MIGLSYIENILQRSIQLLRHTLPCRTIKKMSDFWQILILFWKSFETNCKAGLLTITILLVLRKKARPKAKWYLPLFIVLHPRICIAPPPTHPHPPSIFVYSCLRAVQSIQYNASLPSCFRNTWAFGKNGKWEGWEVGGTIGRNIKELTMSGGLQHKRKFTNSLLNLIINNLFSP